MGTDLSRYLEHLPAIFQEDPLAGRFLLAFERILTGLPTADALDLPPVPPGIEQIIDQIEEFFDPAKAPPGFLPWLAGWIATSLREDWDTATRRRFIANIVPLYRRRGTRRAIQKILQLYLSPNADPQGDGDQDVEVLEANPEGEPAFPPRYFQVRFSVPKRDPALLSRMAVIAIYIIDREKPAHTFYGLRLGYPAMQIADPPTYDPTGAPVAGVFVGHNTVLGSVTT
jgi:phage tail-like protein